MKASVTIGVLAIALLACSNSSQAQESILSSLDQLKQNLDLQEAMLDATARDSVPAPSPANSYVQQSQFVQASSCEDAGTSEVPLVCELPQESNCDADSKESKVRVVDYFVGYDKGFVIRAFDKTKNPSSLKLNGWIQFRHHAFSRDEDSWTDNAGVVRPMRSRNAFDIERARLVYSGTALDSRSSYFLQLDGDTDGSHTVDFFDYWWGWRFSDSFQIQLGKRKVPASRQWLLTARRTRFVERPMTNDFFRPDRTVGIFGVGKIGESIRYQLMLGNGYSSSNLANSRTDEKFTIAATSSFDPLGDIGGSIVDESGESPFRLRLGHSMVYAAQKGSSAGQPLAETNYLRLSDGTRLAQIGAIDAGVTVSDVDVLLYGVDVAAKWNGWSFNAEYFARWIENLRGDGPLSIDELFQQGYYVEGGRFLLPNQLDVNARYSQVMGEFGTSSEIALGANWYPLSRPTSKVSVDVTALDGSPLQNTASDILAGDDGLLFRTQYQVEF
ncbi:porin [Stieleria marina]|uniref:Phosphate-selective porin O and P n=1 Tax=Stieleria marina TaxID=1930275 RepID=A0A517NZH6_9BACT|nr:Phosphate-selective porin O and P [Planctomycetes bacterium K23_9]